MPKHSSIYLERVQPIIIKPLVAAVIGLNESIVIQQVHYWLQRSTNDREGRLWIYNTYGEWAEQFPFWSESTIGRIFRRLEDEGLILSKQFNAGNYDHTKWYTIDYEKLDATLEASGKFDDSNLTPSDNVKLEPSDDSNLTPSTLNKDYQETTSENGDKKLTPHQAMMGVLEEVCGTPIAVMPRRYGEVSKILRDAGRTPDDVKHFGEVYRTMAKKQGWSNIPFTPSPNLVAKYIHWVDIDDEDRGVEPIVRMG